MKKLGKKAVVNAIAEQNGINRKQIYRYLRLNYLIPELQKWVEDKVLTIEAAVELSFLSGESPQQARFILGCRIQKDLFFAAFDHDSKSALFIFRLDFLFLRVGILGKVLMK